MSIFTGATINGEHTFRDWNSIITNSDIISTPEPNTTYLEVPGRNGRLDLSEALTGDITYKNRTIKLQLAESVNPESWYERCIHIFNMYHGRLVEIIFDDDPNHFYKGRAAVSDPQRIRNGAQLLLTIDAEPFRYENTFYSVVGTSIEGAPIEGTLENTRMSVCPDITVPSDCELVIGDITYSLFSGTQQIPSFILPEGSTDFQVTGTSSIGFSYRRGCL